MAEFYGTRHYNKTVPQQNSMAKYHNNVTTRQYRNRILWQNVATLKQNSIMSKMLWQNITSIQQQNVVVEYRNTIVEFNGITSKCGGKISLQHHRVLQQKYPENSTIEGPYNSCNISYTQRLIRLRHLGVFINFSLIILYIDKVIQ